MGKLHASLILFLALAFGLFSAIPAHDVPETPYDESETAPYESAPSLLNEAVDSARMLLPAAPTPSSPSCAALPTGRAETRIECMKQVHPISDCLALPAYSLRC